MFAIFGAIIALAGAAVVVAKVIDADASTALKVVGFSLIAVGVLIFIISLMRRTTRRQE
ncbi:hypothetical protein [Streptomyces sp. NPDC055189]